MSATLNEALTVYGQPIAGLSFPIGSSVAWTISAQIPSTRTAFDLTGCTLKMSLCALDSLWHPSEPPAATWNGAISSPATNGISTVSWLPADTGTLSPGKYALDYWITDSSNNRLQIMATSIVELTAVATLPS